MPETLSYICPFCARAVRVGGPCPGCEKKSPKPGKKSWEQDKSADGLDLPDSAYADDNASDQSRRPTLRAGIAWYWYVVAALLVASLVLGIVRFH
mgnify:CR=1 FL=1